MDAGNMLKPMLARGELHMIGATTLDEYRKHIEKDAALERRFQQVMVDEPSVEDTISILRGLRERLEVFHGVKIQDTALVAAATLSHRYITDRFLPGQGHRPRRRGLRPAAYRDRLHARRTRRDHPPGHPPGDRGGRPVQGDRPRQPKARWRSCAGNWPTCAPRPTPSTPSGRPNARPSAACRNCARNWSRSATRPRRPNANYDLNRAAELRYGTPPELERRLAAEEEQLAAKQGENRLLREVVTEDEIAEIVAAWTGIPVDPAPGGRTREAAAPRRDPAASASSARTRPSSSSPTPSSAPAPASATRAGPSARSSSSAPPASGRPSWPRRSPRPCSTPRRTWSAST